MSLVIRPALRTDAQQILDFITELAEYERARDEVLATPQDIERSLFDAGSTVHCLMAEREGRAIGFAIYFYSYSTWLGRNGIYLEDLYITPNDRGDGAGRRIADDRPAGLRPRRRRRLCRICRGACRPVPARP